MNSEKPIYDFETEFVICEGKTRICNYTSSSIQTDEDPHIAEIERLKKEVAKLKNENIRLTHDIKEIANLENPFSMLKFLRFLFVLVYDVTKNLMLDFVLFR